jgi:hypothetical protein
MRLIRFYYSCFDALAYDLLTSQCVTDAMEAFCLLVAVNYAKGEKFGEVLTFLCADCVDL